MAVCNNCGKKLGCGCQKRTSPKGTSCCASCVTSVIQKESVTITKTTDTPAVSDIKVTTYIKK
jgi:hypothetical protein